MRYRGFESHPLRQIWKGIRKDAFFYLIDWVCGRDRLGSTSEHRSRRMPLGSPESYEE